MANNQEQNTSVSGRTRVMQAASLVGAAMLVSRIIGLVRDIVIKQYLGVSSLEAVAFEAANRFPETIFLIVAGGAVGSAFIPTFAGYFSRDDEAGGWRLFSAVINLITVVVTAVAGITAVFAPQFITFFLSSQVAENPELLALTVRLMRILLLSPIIFGVSGVIMGALNARQHFLLPALAPIIYNLAIIAGAVTAFWLGKPVELGLAWGTVFGALGHLSIQLPGLRQKKAHYSPILTLRDPGVRQVLRLMAPRVLGLSFSEINAFVALFLSDMMPFGSFPALNTARRIMIMPQGILGQAMGIAAFPTLAELAAREAWEEMRQILADSLRMLYFLGLPTAVFLMILRKPIIVLLYQRGFFGADDAALVTWALLFYAFGLIALTSLEVVARAFYALSDTMTPVLAGFVQIVVMTGLSVWLMNVFEQQGWLSLGGVALAFSISNFIEVGVLMWLLRRKMHGLNGRYLLDGLMRISAAGIVMAVIMQICVNLTAQNIFLQTGIATIVGGTIYFIATFLLQVPEVQQIIIFVRRRLPI